MKECITNDGYCVKDENNYCKANVCELEENQKRIEKFKKMMNKKENQICVYVNSCDGSAINHVCKLGSIRTINFSTKCGSFRTEKRFSNFIKNFRLPYLEDSFLWYALEGQVQFYLDLSVHERINFKQSFIEKPEDPNSPWRNL